MTTRAADQQIMVGTAATLSWTSLDSTGEPAAAAGAVDVVVTKADGTSVLASGAAATSGNTHSRTLPPTSNVTLERLTAVWTDTGDSSTATTHIEVVGGFYFTLATARSRDRSLDDAGGYTTEQLLEARRAVEAFCEKSTGVAWVPRWRQVRISGSGTRDQYLPDPMLRTVRAVRVYSDGATYTSFTADHLAAIPANESGIATRADGNVWPAGTNNIVIEYEHGHDRPPADLVNATIIHLRLHLNETRSGFSGEPQIVTDINGNAIDTPSPWRTVLGAYKRHRMAGPGFA